MLSTGPTTGLSFTTDDQSTAIADRMMEAMGGQENWDQARFIRFTMLRRGHALNLTWDRYTGRYRLEAENDAGVPYVVLMNINSRQGKAYLDGKEVTDGKELSDFLNRALGMWHGETYWLLMPFKWRDPGVILSYEGQEKVGNVNYDVVHLTFDNVGRTPGDQFWAYVNPDTHLMDRWKFKLEKGFEGEYEWTGWQRVGGLLIATERVGAKETIKFEDIVVTDHMPDSVFESPAPVKLP
jgi:hypothetical protein